MSSLAQLEDSDQEVEDSEEEIEEHEGRDQQKILRVEEDVGVTAAFRPRHSYLCDEQRS